MSILLMSDPRIQAIEVQDNGDQLVDLRAVPELRLDSRLADREGMFARLRAGTLNRLLTAQASLPDGVQLLIVEGYRPAVLQHRYFDDYQQELRVLQPDWPAERVWVEASKYVSPPMVGPHRTGGAVDLTLCTADGIELDLGTAVNDSPVTSQDACFMAAPGLSGQARANRDLLAAALTGAGLVNYPTEWWHWSYGERYWAATLGADHAIYGTVQHEPDHQGEAQ